MPSPGDPFYAPVAISNTPQTFSQRFSDYAVASFGPKAVLAPAIIAGIRMARPPHGYPREWRDGAEAYGRNYADALARRTSLETARFLTAAALHEDFRYRPSTNKNGFARAAHAIGFTFVDRSAGGGNRLAVSNFVAAGADGFVGNLYLPSGYNTRSRAETRVAVSFAGFAVQNVLREFSPDILTVAHKMGLPFPRLPFPEWWTKLDRP